MTHRSRVLAFGSATALVVIGAACVAVFDGLASEVVAIALITAGLGAAVLLAFLEVGLSEDHAREDEEERRRGGPKRHTGERRLSLRRRPRRPG